MAVQSSFYAVTSETLTYPQTKHIPTKEYVRVYLRQTDTAVWELYDYTKYSLINNTIVLSEALDPTVYDMIEIRIADSVDELVDSISDIAIVAAISEAVSTVANSSDNVTIVATHITEVDTVATSINDVNIVAATIANVEAVAANESDIDTVAAGITDITIVSTYIQDVINTSSNMVDITNVSTNMPDIVLLAANMADIDTVLTYIEAINTVAINIVDVNNYSDTYYGPLPSDPLSRVDGSESVVGDLYFNTTYNEMRVFNGAYWPAVVTTDVYSMQESDDRFVNAEGDKMSGDLGFISQSDGVLLTDRDGSDAVWRLFIDNGNLGIELEQQSGVVAPVYETSIVPTSYIENSGDTGVII